MRILIVEDERKVAAFLRQALHEEGYVVDVAYDGEEGLSLASLNEYNLMLLDWLLPKRDGKSLCEAVRNTGKTVPILMLTARDSVDDRIQGLDSGADDYLTKPFALGELLARVRALLRRNTAGVPVILRVGDLSLHPVTHHVQRGSNKITLSTKEYALLEYLMRNIGQIVTRSMIAEDVWDFDSGTNVVDVYINYLRNKIDRGYKKKLIHTIRGIGYRIEDTNHAG